MSKISQFKTRLSDDLVFREQIASRYRLVLLDEAQDSTIEHFEIVKHLTCVHRNLLAVADPYQTIYDFGKSDVSVRNFIDFSTHCNPPLFFSQSLL